jgi:hypothetical protein
MYSKIVSDFVTMIVVLDPVGMLVIFLRAFGFLQQALTTAVLAVALVIFFVILLAAKAIMRVIGTGGANVLRRIMGDPVELDRRQYGARRFSGLARSAAALRTGLAATPAGPAAWIALLPRSQLSAYRAGEGRCI